MSTFVVRRSRVRSTDILRAQSVVYQGSVAWSGVGLWSHRPGKKLSGGVSFIGTANATVVPIVVATGHVGWVGSGTFFAAPHAVFDCRPGPAVLFHSHTFAVSSHAKTVAVLNCP